VLVAFHVSNRRAGGGERVQVTHDEVRVIGLNQGRAMTLWSSPTAFTRVEIDKADGLVARVRVRLRDRSHALADALGPAERGCRPQCEAPLRNATLRVKAPASPCRRLR
jgi:uncharacterized membrane protein